MDQLRKEEYPDLLGLVMLAGLALLLAVVCFSWLLLV
jgi:hypothetical protein